MSKIPELTGIEINMDEKVSSEIESNFRIEKILGLGGSGTVFKAKVLNDIPQLSLKSDTDIALKLCNNMLTYEGCILLKDEAEYTNTFSILNNKNICYNYPVIYGYFHRCLFFTIDEVKQILKFIKDNNIKKGIDAFILYSTTPKDTDLNDIDSTILEYICNIYDSNTDLLLKAREELPKTDNILGLYYLSKRGKDHINHEYKEKNEILKWDNQTELYDYLELQEEVECDMFLIMQYLQGKTLLEIRQLNSNFKFSNSIFFEYMYSTIVRLFYIKKNQVDIQTSNSMITTTNIPRIYHYKQKYYIIRGDMFYWIDIADLTDVLKVVKSDFKYQDFYTEEQAKLLNKMFESKDIIQIELFLEKLFNWILDKIPVMNEESISKYIIVNYNYRFIETSKIL